MSALAYRWGECLWTDPVLNVAGEPYVPLLPVEQTWATVPPAPLEPDDGECG